MDIDNTQDTTAGISVHVILLVSPGYYQGSLTTRRVNAVQQPLFVGQGGCGLGEVGRVRVQNTLVVANDIECKPKLVKNHGFKIIFWYVFLERSARSSLRLPWDFHVPRRESPSSLPL